MTSLAPKLVPPPAASGLPGAADNRPLEVLVVDDDDSARRAVVLALRALGHTCRSAEDGVEALEMHTRHPADVIISDWDMPRMDGPELCERVRALEGHPYAYFIFMTAWGDKDHFRRGMAVGADDFQAKPVDLDELEARVACAQRVISVHRKLAEQNEWLKRDSQASFRAARIDALTEVPNRLRMQEDLEALSARAKRYGHGACAALCDIDDFKTYNDRFGHLAGDEVLRTIADTLRKHVRQGDSLYRYGGEEFLIVLPEQSLDEACSALERVRRAVERLEIPAVLSDGSSASASMLRVTISVGVAEIRDALDIDGWLRRADEALYRAKAMGKNRVERD